ncbi:MAG: hypothetical protein R3286_03560 [Gammaproteobacteria bacterium]|nr:hypothetical protein [Gammaproteobacteria bacterium]
MVRHLAVVHRELAAEHAELMALVTGLASHPGLPGLVPLLETLHEALIRHFSHEQFPGGLYEALGGLGAEHHEEIRALIREHCTILSDVRGLLEHARAAEPEAEHTLLARRDAVVAAVRAHEEREHRLADRALHRGSRPSS